MQTINPPGWPRPMGYANGISARGRMVFVAGQIGWDSTQKFASDGFVDQFGQALDNVLEILAAAEAGPEHVVRMTWFITSKANYLACLREVGAAYRARMGKHYPAMSVVEVGALMEDRAQVEIEATAVVEDEG